MHWLMLMQISCPWECMCVRVRAASGGNSRGWACMHAGRARGVVLSWYLPSGYASFKVGFLAAPTTTPSWWRSELLQVVIGHNHSCQHLCCNSGRHWPRQEGGNRGHDLYSETSIAFEVHGFESHVFCRGYVCLSVTLSFCVCLSVYLPQ